MPATKEQIRQKLNKLHEEENAYNKEMTRLFNQCKWNQKRMSKLATLVSKNMLYRNKLINQL